MPRLFTLYRQNSHRGLKMLLIATGAPATLKEFAHKKHVPCPVLVDPNRKVYTEYRSHCTPTTMLIDRSGKIVLSLSSYGAVTQFEEQLVPAVAAALRS